MNEIAGESRLTGVIQVRQNSTVKLYHALKFSLVIMRNVPIIRDLKMYSSKS